MARFATVESHEAWPCSSLAPAAASTSCTPSAASRPPGTAYLFLVGISGHFPVRTARYALLGIASVLLAFSVVQLLELPGPPA